MNCLETEGLVQEIKPILQTQKKEITNICLSTLAALPWAEDIPSPKLTLAFCSSMRRRRRAPALKLPELATLNSWAISKQSTLLFVTSRSIQASKDLSIDLANVLTSSMAPTIWVFRHSNYWESRPTFATILRSLTLQALTLFPDCLSSGPCSLSSSQLLEASTEDDWLNIIGRVFFAVDRIYILLDTDILALASNHDKYGITRWLEKLMSRVGKSRNMKIFVSATMINKSYISREWETGSWSELMTDYVDSSIEPLTSKRSLQMTAAKRRKRFQLLRERISNTVVLDVQQYSWKART